MPQKNPKTILKKQSSTALLTVLVPLSFVDCAPAAAQTLPIVVSGVDNLNFGSFYTQGSAGEVLISTLGARSTTGGVATIGGAGLSGAGSISISASTGVVVTISMTTTSFNISNGGGDMMAIDDFHINGVASGPSITMTLTQSPSTIPIGGTINVPLSQAEGTYVGDYTVNVVYQ